MSSRANLLPAPVIGAGGGAAPTPTPRPLLVPPTVNDPIVNQMRPDPKYGVAQALIARDGTGDFTTFADAFAHADDLRFLAMALGGASTSSARYRVDYFVKPGFYDETIDADAPINVAFYALDPTPGSTTLNWGITTGRPGNDSLYWEGIDINNPTRYFNPKYPVHHTNYGTTIFTRCTFNNNSNGAGGGKTGIGMDGADYGTLVLHDVIITAGGGTNLHGWAPPAKSYPETVVLSKVRADDTIGYGANGGTTADEIWLSECVAPSLEVGGEATIMHVSKCQAENVSHTVGGRGAANLGIDTRSDWPVPVGGLSAYDRQRVGLP